VASLEQMAGEDAQAVAAFLRLAAVRVENAQAEGGRIFGHRQRAEQEAIGPDAVAAIAEGTDGLGRWIEGRARGIDHEVVVSERMELGELEGFRHGLVPGVKSASQGPQAPAGISDNTSERSWRPLW